MKKTEQNLLLINLIFIVSLIVTNVTACKVIDFGITIFEIPIKSGAAITYAFTFLCTDIISEIWGKTEANKTVKYGLYMQIFASCLILLIQILPADNSDIQYAYNKLLGQSWCFTLACLIAYYVSQKWDVWIFHYIKNKFVNKKNINRYKWIWNNASTISSQVIDTIIYAFIAFGIGLEWLNKENGFQLLFGLVIGQYLLKCSLAILDTPFFYLFTHHTDCYNKISK